MAGLPLARPADIITPNFCMCSTRAVLFDVLLQVGDEVKLEVLRGNETKTLTLVLEESRL